MQFLVPALNSVVVSVAGLMQIGRGSTRGPTKGAGRLCLGTSQS